MLGSEHGGLDAVDEIVDSSGESVVVVKVLDGGFDCTALTVSEDHDEIDAEFGDGVFDASFHRDSSAADVVTGDSDGEDVPDTNVEEDLWGDAGVGTTDDSGDGILTGSEGHKIRGRTAWVGDGSSDEAFVAFE